MFILNKKILFIVFLSCVEFVTAGLPVSGVHDSKAELGLVGGVEYQYISCAVLPKTNHSLTLEYTKKAALVVTTRGVSDDVDFKHRIAKKQNVTALFVHPEARKSIVVDVVFAEALNQPLLPIGVTLYGTLPEVDGQVLGLVKTFFPPRVGSLKKKLGAAAVVAACVASYVAEKKRRARKDAEIPEELREKAFLAARFKRVFEPCAATLRLKTNGLLRDASINESRVDLSYRVLNFVNGAFMDDLKQVSETQRGDVFLVEYKDFLRAVAAVKNLPKENMWSVDGKQRIFFVMHGDRNDPSVRNGFKISTSDKVVLDDGDFEFFVIFSSQGTSSFDLNWEQLRVHYSYCFKLVSKK